MALTLAIENETSLPDGGPLSVTVSGKRGLDIGRDQHLDWTLPDPSRFISGKHCEIRYREGCYWLYDVSTNGTFLYGSEGRIKGPHRLRNGDRLTIGHYIVAVTIDGDEADATAPKSAPPQPAAYHELWKTSDDAAPPIDAAQLRPPRESSPLNPDFLDWATDIPDVGRSDSAAQDWHDPPAPPPPAPAAPPPLPDDLSWANTAPRPQPVPEPPPQVPSPRRPAVWVAGDPDGPWNASAAPPSPEPVPPPDMAPQPAPQAPTFEQGPPFPTHGGDVTAFVRRLAQGAGVPEDVFASQSPDQLAEQIGMLTRVVVENLRQLLQARLQAKRLARTSNQTMVEALDNNPLKFSPSAEDAMRIMFGPPTRSYLDARRTLEQSFEDLKAHQIKTYSAMQQALRMLLSELDPQTVENEAERDRGIASVVGSRKARLWDAYQARWQAKSSRSEGGLIDAFMLYFAECYDRGGEGR